MTSANPVDIRATWDWLAHAEHGVSEVRAIRPEGGVAGIGFFDDADAFVAHCTEINATANVYVGIQPRPRRLLARAPNEIRPLRTGANARDIEIVTGAVIDLDPVRPKHTASTDEELGLAVEAAERAALWCESEGLVRPRFMRSGNGAQLWFALPPLDVRDEPRREQIQAGLKAFEAELRRRFQTTRVTVDSIHDLPRIIKVIGTAARKGDGAGDRPHRTSSARGSFERIVDPKLAERVTQHAPARADPPVARPRVSLPVVGTEPSTPASSLRVKRTADGTIDWPHPVEMCSPVQRLWDRGLQDRSAAIWNMVMFFAHRGLPLEDITELVLEYDRRGLGKLDGRDGAKYVRHAYEKIVAGARADGSIAPPCHALQRVGYCRVNHEPSARCEVYDVVFNVEAAIEAVPADTAPLDLEYRLAPIFDAIAHRPPQVHGAYLGQISKRFHLQQRDLRKALAQALQKATSAAGAPAAREPVPAAGQGLPIDGEIHEDVSCYLVATDGEMRAISSFVISPTLRIVTEDTEYICGNAITDRGATIPLKLPLSAFHSKRDLIRNLSSADLQWVGTDNNVQGLLRLLAARDVPRRKGVAMLGEHVEDEKRLWVGAECVIDETGFVDAPSVTYVSNGGSLHKRIAYRATLDDDFMSIASAVFEHLPSLNRPAVVLPIIGWWFATPAKPYLLERVGSFPLLVVWGSPGSGKSTICTNVMWPLFGVEGEAYSATETEFALLKLLTATCSVPVVIDEYKPHDMARNRLHALHRYMRRLYRGEVEERGRQDLRVNTYHLAAPLCLAGEARPSEAALLERMVTAVPDKTALDAEPRYRTAMAELRALDLRLFAPRYIQFCLSRDYGADLEIAAAAAKTLLRDRKVPLRVADNIRAMLLGIHLFEEFARSLEIALPSELDVQAAVDAVLEDVLETGNAVRTALDHFLEMLSVMAAQGELRPSVHYAFADDRLALHLETCYDAFRAHCNRISYEGEMVDLRALRRLVLENKQQGGYVVAANERVRFSGKADRRRAVLIDPARADFIADGAFTRENEGFMSHWSSMS
ncbi:hypothetical protein LZC95_50010 [Pendulispora brunnea]|uniref:Uncharacterized protein n=1 Tax=Pendulispora brunnea TaxID=2905690 RepID=A0ABZ2K786_9BACT